MFRSCFRRLANVLVSFFFSLFFFGGGGGAGGCKLPNTYIYICFTLLYIYIYVSFNLSRHFEFDLCDELASK